MGQAIHRVQTHVGRERPHRTCVIDANYGELAEPDVLRSMLTSFVEVLMGAEADEVCGAPYGTRSAERTNSRNGYRAREWDTRVGSLEVAIPKLRSGSYFPNWLPERRKRAERALTTVVATCYLLGVSTRRMEKLVETLGITTLSKSQVSVMALELDEHVESFRTRALDAGPHTFLAADALTMKVREGVRVVNPHVLVATGINADGHREILDLDICSGETEAGWLTLFRGLVAPGLSGAALVTSDAHAGTHHRDREVGPLRGDPAGTCSPGLLGREKDRGFSGTPAPSAASGCPAAAELAR